MGQSEVTVPRAAAESRFTMSLGTLGMFLTLLWIGMFFAGLAGVYFFLFWDHPPERALRMPGWLWASTVLIVVSSVLLEWARGSLLRARLAEYRRLLRATMAAGTMFVVSQVLACLNLIDQGAYETARAAGSVYFSFSGIHAVHLLGGLAGLVWLYRKAIGLPGDQEQPLRRHRGLAKNVALYWHSMGVIWLGLFVLLLSWR